LHVVRSRIHSLLLFETWRPRCIKRGDAVVGEVAVDCLLKTVSDRILYYKHGKGKTLTVNVLETPSPHVNSDSYTPQLPLLELRVKPDPIAI
jgi:hypothetical protein